MAGRRIKSLREAFRRAARRAGIPADLRQHDLRHRRVTKWLGDGHPIHKVREALGHSSVQVTEEYQHLVPEHLRSLVEGDEADPEQRLIDLARAAGLGDVLDAMRTGSRVGRAAHA